MAFFKEEPIFAFLNGPGFGADQFHSVFLQNTVVAEVEGEIERGLAPQGGQQRIRLFALDYLACHFDRKRFNISSIGEFRIGHYSGRIAIDQNDLVALFPQRFAGLGAAIVKFACLSDYDGSGTQDEDSF